MHVGQEILHVHLMIGLESAQGCAVLAEIFLAQAGNILRGDAHLFDHILAHAGLERGPKTAGGGVERIVEVEEDRSEFHGAIIL